MKFAPPHHLQISNIIEWLFNVLTPGFEKHFKSMFMNNPDIQNPMLNWVFSLQYFFLCLESVFVTYHNIYVE